MVLGWVVISVPHMLSLQLSFLPKYFSCLFNANVIYWVIVSSASLKPYILIIDKNEKNIHT